MTFFKNDKFCLFFSKFSQDLDSDMDNVKISKDIATNCTKIENKIILMMFFKNDKFSQDLDLDMVITKGIIATICNRYVACSTE